MYLQKKWIIFCTWMIYTGTWSSDTCSSKFVKATRQASFKCIKAIRVPCGMEGRRSQWWQTSVDGLGTKSAHQKHLEHEVQGLKHSQLGGISSRWYYLCMPAAFLFTGGASGTPSSLTPQEAQHDTFPEVSSVWLLLPSGSKDTGTSAETERVRLTQLD